MKIFNFIAFLFLIFFTTSTKSQNTIKEGLTARLTLNDIPAGKKVLGDTTWITGVYPIKDRFDIPNKAIRFKGDNNQYVLLCNSDVFETYYSINLWFRTEHDEIGSLVSFRTENKEEIEKIFNIKVNKNSKIEIADSDNVYLQSSFKSGVWNMVTFIVTKYEMKLYLNSVLKGSKTLAENTILESYIYIGCKYSFKEPFYKGDIDDIMIYNRPIEGAEVKQLYLKNYLDKTYKIKHYLDLDYDSQLLPLLSNYHNGYDIKDVKKQEKKIKNIN